MPKFIISGPLCSAPPEVPFEGNIEVMPGIFQAEPISSCQVWKQSSSFCQRTTSTESSHLLPPSQVAGPLFSNVGGPATIQLSCPSYLSVFLQALFSITIALFTLHLSYWATYVQHMNDSDCSPLQSAEYGRSEGKKELCDGKEDRRANNFKIHRKQAFEV